MKTSGVHTAEKILKVKNNRILCNVLWMDTFDFMMQPWFYSQRLRNAVNREGFKPEKNHKVLGIIELDQNCGSSYSLGLILFF